MRLKKREGEGCGMALPTNIETLLEFPHTKHVESVAVLARR